jgi:hypothetical protein
VSSYGNSSDFGLFRNHRGRRPDDPLKSHASAGTIRARHDATKFDEETFGNTISGNRHGLVGSGSDFGAMQRLKPGAIVFLMWFYSNNRNKNIVCATTKGYHSKVTVGLKQLIRPFNALVNAQFPDGKPVGGASTQQPRRAQIFCNASSKGLPVFKTKLSLLSVAVTLALAACGGGGGSSPVTSNTGGKVVDGYLSGATVFCDANKNGVSDAGEATTTTDTGGNFTFSPGCEGTIVASGGTDATTGHAFKGTLSAQAGSAVTTPLTSLIADTGMTGAQLATALSLPAGTDTTKIDPVAATDKSLLKKTLAVQQIVQQLANMFASLAGNTDIAGIYSKVGGALAKSLMANAAPLISADGTVNTSVVNAAATGALAALKADPKFASITISDADLAAAAAQIGAQAQLFATASDADLDSLATSLQNPAATPIDTKGSVNYLALKGDSIIFNRTAATSTTPATPGTPISYSSLAAGTSISTLSTIGLDFHVAGTPMIDTVAQLALELVEVGGEARVLQLMIDKVNIKNVNGQLTLAYDDNAKVYVYGHTGSGTDINITLATTAGFKPLTIKDNYLNLNYTSMVQRVIDNGASANIKTTADKFTSITGTFKVSVAVGGVLPIRNFDSSSALPATAIRITGSSPAQSVNGVGVSGTLIIQ